MYLLEDLGHRAFIVVRHPTHTRHINMQKHFLTPSRLTDPVIWTPHYKLNLPDALPAVYRINAGKMYQGINFPGNISGNYNSGDRDVGEYQYEK